MHIYKQAIAREDCSRWSGSVIFEFVGEAERIDIIEGLVHAANTRYSLVFTQLNLTKI
jgi:hypothetical protein